MNEPSTTSTRRPLLFRLQERSSATHFDEKPKLVASKLKIDSKQQSRVLEELSQGKPSFFIKVKPEGGDVEAVGRHITSWKDKNRDPSNFISLTFSVLWVFWKWKSRVSKLQNGSQDDSKMILIKTSDIRGRAKLGTEILRREKQSDGYRFAAGADEVIVARIVQPQAILGTVTVSEIQHFVPSWLRQQLEFVGEHEPERPFTFKSFLKELKPPDDEVECIRASLYLALAILAPMLVLGKQEHVVIENNMDKGSHDCSGLEVAMPKVGLSGYDMHDASVTNTVAEQKTAEEGGDLAASKRGRSPGAASQSTGIAEESPRQVHAAKRGRFSDGDKPPHKHEGTSKSGSANTERDPKGPTTSPEADESIYIGALAAQIWCSCIWEKRWNGRQERCTAHARKLLKRYTAAMEEEKFRKPVETLRKVWKKYDEWDEPEPEVGHENVK